MRFGVGGVVPVYPHLPVTLPAHLYNNVKQKKVKTVPEARLDRVQKKIVRRIKQELPPGLLTDEKIFPMNDDVRRMVVRLQEGGGVRYVHLCRDIKCYMDGERLVMVGAEVIYSGDFHLAFEFAMKNCPRVLRRLHQLYRLMRPPMYNDLDPEEFLRKHRIVRRYSRGIDYISKLDELDYCDQDTTIEKFNMELFEPKNSKVLHVGSGTCLGPSQYSLYQVYERVVCIDPRCVDGGDYRSALFEVDKVKPGWDIISDLAFGDEFGLVPAQQEEFLAQLSALRKDRLIVVKICLVRGIPYRMRVAAKPRPHNLEIIAVFDDSQPTLEEQFEELFEEVKRANEERTSRCMRLAFGGLKPLKPTPHDIQQVARLVHVLPPFPPVGRPKYVMPDRNLALMQQFAATRYGERFRKLLELNSDVEFRPGTWSILPFSFELSKDRPLHMFDPGYTDLRFSLSTIWRTAEDRGYEIKFDKYWMIC